MFDVSLFFGDTFMLWCCCVMAFFFEDDFLNGLQEPNGRPATRTNCPGYLIKLLNTGIKRLYSFRVHTRTEWPSFLCVRCVASLSDSDSIIYCELSVEISWRVHELSTIDTIATMEGDCGVALVLTEDGHSKCAYFNKNELFRALNIKSL